MRKFNVETVSAVTALGESRILWANIRRQGLDKADRAAGLLLHWWSAGHDPKRSLIRCDQCHWAGSGLEQYTVGRCYASTDEYRECATCKGTGKRPLPLPEWMKL